MSDTPTPEKMLYEPDPEPDLSTFVKDTSVEVTPATFDSSAFLAGVRPTRRSVQIIERADLLATMEYWAELYAEADAEDDDAECERIAAEFQAAADAFHGSKRWYTLEKRSSEWQEQFREDTAKAHGLNPGDDADKNPTAQQRKDRMTLLLHQVAAQIVSPEGTTYDDLAGLYETNEGELSKLIVAMGVANNQQAGAAKVATPGFSLRRSERKGTPGSSPR